MENVTLNITGMACAGCAGTVAQALQALPGVVEVEVSHADAKAEVRFDPARLGVEQLRAAVEQAGYKVVD